MISSATNFSSENVHGMRQDVTSCWSADLSFSKRKTFDWISFFPKYFDKLDGPAMNISIQGSLTYSVLSAASELNSIQGQQEQKKKRQVLPENIIQKIVYHA